MRWAAYYDYRAIGDVLLIVFDMSAKTNRVIRQNDIVALYHDDKMIGINILIFSDIVKMHTHGRIFLFPIPVIKIINDLLMNAGLAPLDYLNDSGFYVGQFIANTEQGAIISLGDQEVKVSPPLEANALQYVVVATSDAFLFNGKRVWEVTNDDYYVCRYEDLGLKGKDIIFISEEEKELGSDYFA